MSHDEDFDEEEKYVEAVEEVKEEYEPKLKKLLEEVCALATGEGYECSGPSDWSDETYKWAVMVTPTGGDVEDSVDVSVEIAESKAYDGTLAGINFSMNAVGYEGEIIGGLTPYNYTDQVWVPVSDAKAIKERWHLFNGGADANEVLYLIDQFYDNKSENPLSSRKLKSKLLR